jgi:hypothetical protein
MAMSRQSDECANGHKRTPENTYHYRNEALEKSWAICRDCQRESRARHRDNERSRRLEKASREKMYDGPMPI